MIRASRIFCQNQHLARTFNTLNSRKIYTLSILKKY